MRSITPNLNKRACTLPKGCKNLIDVLKPKADKICFIRVFPAWLIIAAAPSLPMLGLFYSLAFHMRHSLGSWPTAIGENGFPPGLAAHASVTENCCIVFSLFTLLVIPVSGLLCVVLPKWRRFVPGIAIHAARFTICWILMNNLAPAPFLDWWRD
jgi:hypothetical protein